MLPTTLRMLLVGIGAGLVSAVLIVSASHGALGLRFTLSFLALQPGMLVGFGWGWPATVVSGLVGMLGVTMLTGFREAAIFLATVAVPVSVLTYLAGLHREVPAPTQSGTAVEWYPVGRILGAATLLTIALAALLVWLIGDDLETTRKGLRSLIEKVFFDPPPAVTPPGSLEETIASLTEMALYALPAAGSLTWLAGFVFNLWMAGRLTLASGRLARPWPDLAMTQLPRSFPLILIAGLALTTQTGVLGLWGAGITGAMLVAYMFIGLAIFHATTRGHPMRPMILGALYGAIVVLNGWGLLVVAMIGLFEPFSPLKRKPSGPPQPPPSN